MGRMGLSIVSWNVKGANNQVKQRTILKHLHNLSADIALLQETHLKAEHLKYLRKGWVGEVIGSAPSSKSSGIAILFHKKINVKTNRMLLDQDGRYMIINCEIENNITLVNIYAPNDDKPSFFSEIELKLTDFADTIIIIGGDLNLTMNPNIDKTGKIARPKKSLFSLLKLTQTFNLVDIWRTLHPDERDFTFYSNRHQSFSRIDMFFIPKAFVENVNSKIHPIIISDHAPIQIDINLSTAGSQPRQWKINTSIFESEESKLQIKEYISDFMTNNQNTVSDISTVWEALKCSLRGELIRMASLRNKKQRADESKLLNEIKQMQGEISNSYNEEIWTQLCKKRMEYDNIIRHKVQYKLIRAKAQFYEHGEQAGKLLALRLKKQMTRNQISSIKLSDGSISYDPKQINKAFKEFYENLYKPESNCGIEVIQRYLNGIQLPSLSEVDKKALEEPITLEEIQQAINSFDKNKSPGPDGYNAEFYQIFMADLSPLLLQMYQSSFTNQSFSSSFNFSHITVIHKKDKDPLTCNNYRPISIANLDNKILAKILSIRLSSVIKKKNSY